MPLHWISKNDRLPRLRSVSFCIPSSKLVIGFPNRSRIVNNNRNVLSIIFAWIALDWGICQQSMRMNGTKKYVNIVHLLLLKKYNNHATRKPEGKECMFQLNFLFLFVENIKNPNFIWSLRVDRSRKVPFESDKQICWSIKHNIR